jgi:glycosyltransferase involved in cell wall biosynthesis
MPQNCSNPQGSNSIVRVSIVIPCYNEAEAINELAKQLDNSFLSTDKQRKYLFILVDDGSIDCTWLRIKDFCHVKNSRVLGIKLSRNFGHQKALLAGLDYAVKCSDYILTMDADLQHPIHAGLSMLDLAISEKFNIVLGEREKDPHSSFFKRSTSKSFYKLLNFLGAEIAPNVSDFRVMDRQSTVALVNHGDAMFFTRGIISLIGFKQAVFPYQVARRFAGKSKYSIKKMLKFASEGVISLSIAPLRLTFLASMIIFVICGASFVYTISAWLSGNAVSGWTSIMLSLYILFGFNFLLIGILGEYVGKIYFQSLRRPRYVIQEILEKDRSSDN